MTISIKTYAKERECNADSDIWLGITLIDDDWMTPVFKVFKTVLKYYQQNVFKVWKVILLCGKIFPVSVWLLYDVSRLILLSLWCFSKSWLVIDYNTVVFIHLLE